MTFEKLLQIGNLGLEYIVNNMRFIIFIHRAIDMHQYALQYMQQILYNCFNFYTVFNSMHHFKLYFQPNSYAFSPWLKTTISGLLNLLQQINKLKKIFDTAKYLMLIKTGFQLVIYNSKH